MAGQDTRDLPGKKANGTKMESTFKLLRSKGYIMFDDGEDVLAIRTASYV